MKKLTKQLEFSVENVVTAFLLVLGSVYLLFTGREGYGNIAFAKFAAFAALCGIFLLALTAAYLRERRLPSCFCRKLDAVTACLLGYLLLSLISAICSPFGGIAFIGSSRYEGFITILLYVLIFFTVADRQGSRRLPLYVFGGGMLIFCCISLIQFAGGNPFGLYPERLNYYGAGVSYQGEYLGTIGNVDMVAGLMCIAIPLFLLYIILAKDDQWRMWLLIPLGLCVVVTIRMDVTAAFLGLAGGLLLTIPVVLPRSSRWKKPAVIGVLSFIAAGVIGVFAFDISGGLFHELHQILHGHIEGSYASDRVKIWLEVWQQIKLQPLFGSGPDTLYLWQRGFSQYDAAMNVNVTTVIDVAHNELLNICANQGIPAMLSYLVALILIGIRWVKKAADNTLVAICGSAALCYVIQSMFGMSMCLVAPFFWVMLALTYRATMNE